MNDNPKTVSTYAEEIDARLKDGGADVVTELAEIIRLWDNDTDVYDSFNAMCDMCNALGIKYRDGLFLQ